MRKSQEDSVPFLQPKNSTDSTTEEEDLTGLQRNALTKRAWWPFGIFLAVLIVTNIASLFMGSWLGRANLDHICAIHTSQHETMVLRDVKVTYSSIPFNGSFSKETIYRQRPSPEVDAAWVDLGVGYNPLIVPDDDAEAAGIETDRFHVSKTYGGPGYPAFVAGLHQVHCLNLLRKSLYFNVDYYRDLHQSEFLDEEEIVRLHIGHCMEVIRQRLMCTADTELYPYLWAGDPPHVTPDFNRMSKCRNYDDIRDYARRKQAQWGPNGPDVVPGAGALILDAIP